MSQEIKKEPEYDEPDAKLTLTDIGNQEEVDLKPEKIQYEHLDEYDSNYQKSENGFGFDEKEESVLVKIEPDLYEGYFDDNSNNEDEAKRETRAARKSRLSEDTSEQDAKKTKLGPDERGNKESEEGKKKKKFVESKHVFHVIISEEERRKEHEQLVLTLRATYVCYDCGVGFDDQGAYKSHEKKHSPASGDAKCDICGIYRSSAKTLFYHRNQHYKRFRCAICNFTFRDKEKAHQHVVSVHQEETSSDYDKIRKSIPRNSKTNSKRQKQDQYFACPHCESFYKSEAYMQLHVRTVHKIGGKWLACNCGRVFPNRSRLNDHKANVHGDAYKDNICLRCGKAFKTKSLLNRHQSVHSTETFPCPECDASFRSREYVRIHYKMKHLNMTRAEIKAQSKKYRPLWIHDVRAKGKILFENEEKGEAVESKIQDNLKASESSESRKCICDHCGKEYPTKTILKRHMYAHLDLIFPCNMCDAEFKSPCNLKKHYRRTHKLARGEVKPCDNDGFHWGQDSKDGVLITAENGQDSVGTSEAVGTMLENSIIVSKKFACDECGNRYQSKTLLRRHQLSHTLQTYPCTECAAVFRAPDYLRKHYKRHLLNMAQNHFISGPILMADLVASASKIYTCNDCGKEFKGKSTLKRHLQLVHTDITFPCNECGQRFKTREYVKVHYKIKHLNMSRAEIKAQSKRGDTAVSDEPPPRKHICTYCDKAYPTNALLKRHTHVHMNQSFPCNVCERTFQTLEYLRHHLKTKKHLKMIGADVPTEFKKRKPKRARKMKEEVVLVEKDPLGCDDEFDDDDDDNLNLVDIVAARSNAV